MKQFGELSLAPWMCTGSGLVILAVWYRMLREVLRKRAQLTGRAQGTIVGFERRESGDGEVTLHPMVEFEVAGKLFRFAGGFAIKEPAPPVDQCGTRVLVRYSPSNPKDADLSSDSQRRIENFVLLFMLTGGSLAVVIGVVMFFLASE